MRSSWLYRPRKAVVVVHVRGRLPADEAGAPQAFLGLTINWGAMLGWSAVHGGLDWAAVGPLSKGQPFPSQCGLRAKPGVMHRRCPMYSCLSHDP